MKIYLDLQSGIAGDMLLGACLELGLPLPELEKALRRAVRLAGWRLESRRVERQGWPGRTFRVVGDRPFGSVDEMQRAVKRGNYPVPVAQRALAVLKTLSDAEVAAHRVSRPHFEDEGLGLLDTLVDVLGTSWALWRLGIDEAAASPLHTGRMAPATAQILRRFKIPFYNRESTFELATPTGVAILSQLNATFGQTPTLRLEAAGFGAGSQDTPGRPNLLGIFQVKANAAAVAAQDQVVLLESVIDDMDPRLYPHVSDLLFKEGALDVWWTAAGMKKGRPGIAFSVLCRPEDEEKLLRIVFAETTTLGVRRLPLDRWILPREKKGLQKLARLPSGKTRTRSEFEPTRLAALRREVPLRKLLK